MDIDMTSGSPLATNPDGGEVLGSREGPVPVVRLYGVTRDGFSVMATFHGFTPYIFVSLPQSMDISEGALAQLRSALDVRVMILTIISYVLSICYVYKYPLDRIINEYVS